MKKDHVTLQCDANGKGCGWSLQEKVDDAKKWHNAACPQCGYKPILNDADMGLITGMIYLRDAGLAFIGGKKRPSVTHLDVRFNTRGLREEEEAK